MAVMNNKKGAKAVQTEESIVATEGTLPQEQQQPTGVDPMLKALLEQVKTLTETVKQLKESDNKAQMFNDARKINDDPKKFKYKLWAWIPVLSAKSKKKDATKPYMYFTPKGEQIINQLLTLSLADGSEVDADVNEFGQFHESSELQVATVKQLPNGDKSFIFNTTQYWEIEVLSSVIN